MQPYAPLIMVCISPIPIADSCICATDMLALALGYLSHGFCEPPSFPELDPQFQDAVVATHRPSAVNILWVSCFVQCHCRRQRC